MEEIKFTNKQIRVIANVFSTPSIEEACKQSDISKATFYHWLKDENFKNFLDEKRKEMIEEALNTLKHSISKAVSVLIELTTSRNESIRRFAAKDILDYTLKIIELEGLEKRLERVEKEVFKGK